MNAPYQLSKPVRTTCPYCGVGCGVLARPDGMGGAAIAGDPLHPANFGRLCSKGAALGETLGLSQRLLHPMQRQADGALMRVTWDDALDKVASGLKSIIEREGSNAVAFYLSGQLLTEDYYVANKLMKGFIGSANVDTNSRLCMASSVAGHRRAFGTDTVPGVYADLEEADLLVLVGSNTAWCHPVLYQRMLRNSRERGAKIIVIDPRRTATAQEADLFLPIAPGTDSALFCGLLVHLADRPALDRDYIAKHTEGFEVALSEARAIAPDATATARACGLALSDVTAFFSAFQATPRVVTCFSQGVNQSAQGSDKVNAIINCHLATGRIGRTGMGPFSLTGQPNAMGGREVGGLANQLAAHMGFEPDSVGRVRRFWNAPNMARSEGLKAVDMFAAIARGEIKALWVMATNPAVSLPQASAVGEALQKLELFVVSENVLANDTVEAGAHILLPAAAWGEKDGTVTNSERRISRQRAFLSPPDEARPDWWIVSEVARRLGHGEAFSYTSAAEVFREHAALSAFENDGVRDFDLSGLATLTRQAYDALEPVQWPIQNPRREAGGSGEQRFFASGGFYTPDRKARFVAPLPPAPRTEISTSFPFRLNTGRLRDQWHTMTRTGLSPRLGVHAPEPCVEVHPADAAQYELSDGGFARITTHYGACVLKVVVSEGQQHGSLFAPIHWSKTTASSARIGELVAPITDPFSGQPEAKATPAAIRPVTFRWRGFLLSRTAATLPPGTWWARVGLPSGTGYLFASDASLSTWRPWMAGGCAAGGELAEYADERAGIYRAAAFSGEQLQACLFVGQPVDLPPWDAAKAAFAADSVSALERRVLLSGKSADALAETGPIVCVCFGVGQAAIREAIASGAARSAEELGALLKAGTNCGSCLPELKKMLSEERLADPV